ncbi:MAG: carboxylating nicotinate-nucleotide diphosphorylase [Luminiphilus sp.]|nr:carboxylating nicotinate-nucleotide diphosphorylase [Luminiphilus sp.]MDG1461774.1 carboxylating nicotinate-nucleotide diphosphorylase [Luminiphilus sp.]
MLSPQYIQQLVDLALEEDIGSGDITAELVQSNSLAKASVVTREAGVLCGSIFVNAVFSTLDPDITIEWFKSDGDSLEPNDTLFSVSGNARKILTGERTALNFLQLLSGTASLAKRFADHVAGTGVRLLDTRKTVPGLRLAQKYAVTCGDCHNHRIGLYDAFLIKENHIEACGGIAAAISAARQSAPGKIVEIEVETLDELQLALGAKADRIMLDNFSEAMLRDAVDANAGQSELEASGNVAEHNLRSIAETGVDFISIGALTKRVEPLDLSMRLEC